MVGGGEGWMCMYVCVFYKYAAWRRFIHATVVAEQLQHICNVKMKTAKMGGLHLFELLLGKHRRRLQRQLLSLWLCSFFLSFFFLICRTQMNYLVSHKQGAEIIQTVLIHFLVNDCPFHDAVKSR